MSSNVTVRPGSPTQLITAPAEPTPRQTSPTQRHRSPLPMLRFLLLACLLALSTAFMAPVIPSKISQSKVVMNEEGKGFGGGEATRDPEPTEYDPNDPKGKQQAIHKAESFADYLAKRKAAGGGAIGSSS